MFSSVQFAQRAFLFKSWFIQKYTPAVRPWIYYARKLANFAAGTGGMFKIMLELRSERYFLAFIV